MSRLAIGEDLAARLYAAELAIDRALIETANLAAALPKARAEAWLSIVTGQRAFEGAAATIGALAEARAHIIQTHKTLSALARTLGLEVLAVGPLDKPGDGSAIHGGKDGGASATDMVNKILPNHSSTC